MKKFVVGIVFVAASFFGFMNQSDEEVLAASKRGTVIIDAGHGGKHTGTCGITGNQTRYCEKNANLSVALKLETILESKGYTVKMTRTTDKDFASYITGDGGDLDKRTQYANSMITDPDQTIVISIHHNGHPRSTTIRGIETYYYNGIDHAKKEYPHDPASIKYLPDSKRLAEEVHEEVVDIHNAIDRGIHDDQSFFIIRNSEAPAILAELGYMTNPQEESLIKSSSYQQKSATAIANAVDKYFKVFEVYESDSNKRIGLFDTSEKAISFASKQVKQVYVLDKYNQTVLYDGVNYSVYSKENGLLKEFFKLEDAIAYATSTPSTRIVSIANGHTVWSNYLDKIFVVRNSIGQELNRFVDYREAEKRAKYADQAYIVKETTNKVIWSSVSAVPVDNQIETVNLSGSYRITTSINISKDMYPNGFTSEKLRKNSYISNWV
ncbi:N-acetylmuramoyl-L-alanine amidase family protein [Bacillus coahuilensis]|uniref:N-acetylmuramoyl-L-alanine amidase family protein n=1 Tax=Bacillus coahuilensis TaxID=408580 RepID=UPI0001851250|nr:N-acetylmuramoyl-L-alanine amidase [Bacillus coahuilensis]